MFVTLVTTQGFRIVASVPLGLAVVAFVACNSASSIPSPTATRAVQESPVAGATTVRINESLSIAVPPGYRLDDDGGPLGDTAVQIYGIYAVTRDLQDPPDRYMLTFYPKDSELPFGFGVSALDAVLDNVKKSLADSHYDINDSSVDSRPDGSAIRIRARYSFSGELAQLFFLLRNDGVLITLTAGGPTSRVRVPESQQLTVFTQLVASLSP